MWHAIHYFDGVAVRTGYPQKYNYNWYFDIGGAGVPRWEGDSRQEGLRIGGYSQEEISRGVPSFVWPWARRERNILEQISLFITFPPRNFG